jgi:hypothetical protein
VQHPLHTGLRFCVGRHTVGQGDCPFADVAGRQHALLALAWAVFRLVGADPVSRAREGGG